MAKINPLYVETKNIEWPCRICGCENIQAPGEVLACEECGNTPHNAAAMIALARSIGCKVPK